MLNSILKSIIQVIFKVCAWVLDKITRPLWLLVQVFVPDVSTYLTAATSFFNTKVLLGVAFAREVFFNCTGFPRPLFSVFVTILLGRIGLHVFLLMVRFLFHILKFLHGLIPDPPQGVVSS